MVLNNLEKYSNLFWRLNKADIFPACKKFIPKNIGVNEDGEIFCSPISP
nr:MAG TPA: hypothetical protein [Caudoviricetes sp.]